MKSKLFKRITLLGLIALIALAGAALAVPQLTALASNAAYSGYPTFSITAVVRDQTVAIQTNNLPADQSFDVRMGVYGNLGWGYFVTTINSGGGGSRSYEIAIPSQLAGLDRIAIRIDSWGREYYAYNWFWNNSFPVAATPQPTKAPGTPVPTTPPGYSGYPYFFIASVTRNGKVAITAYNFPPNDTFDVTMNLYGTLGSGGYKVETVTTDATGKLSNTTFSIPGQLDNLDQIAIRLQSPYTGYFGYNWFWNYNN
jgi:hypothetical protein